MAIEFDATSAGSQVSTTSKSWSHTCTGSNLILFVGIQITANTATISGVTYAGVAMTKIASIDWPGSGVGSSALWYIVAPATGANNIVVSASPAAYIDGFGVSYTGASQTGIPDSSNTGSANTLSTTVVATDCWTIMHLASSAGAAVTYNSGTTARVVNWANSDGMLDSNGTVSTGSQSLGMSQSGSNTYRGVIASFAPAAASTIYIPDLRLAFL